MYMHQKLYTTLEEGGNPKKHNKASLKYTYLKILAVRYIICTVCNQRPLFEWAQLMRNHPQDKGATICSWWSPFCNHYVSSENEFEDNMK